MPFSDDCRDAARPAAGAPADPAPGLAELHELARALPGEERAVLLLVARRLTLGVARYGDLHVHHDPRNFAVEALEEAADGFAYAACALLRGSK